MHSREVNLAAGTPVTLVLDEAVTARAVKVGRVIRAHSLGAVRVGQCTVIPDHAPGSFVVAKSQHGQFLGQPDKLVLRAQDVRSAAGTLILLDGEFAVAGEDRTVESLASYSVIGCLFFLVPGERVIMGAGSGWTGIVRHDFTLAACP